MLHDDQLETLARMVSERRALAERNARMSRQRAKERGYDYDLNAEQQEGSHAAYSVVASILEGLTGRTLGELCAYDDPTPFTAYDPETVIVDADGPGTRVGDRRPSYTAADNG